MNNPDFGKGTAEIAEGSMGFGNNEKIERNEREQPELDQDGWDGWDWQELRAQPWLFLAPCSLLLATEEGTTEYAENTEGTADGRWWMLVRSMAPPRLKGREVGWVRNNEKVERNERTQPDVKV